MNAKRRVEYTRQLLESIGLEGQRLQMINVSSAMGGQFAFAAAEITAEIQRLGPNRLGRNGERARKPTRVGSEGMAADEHRLLDPGGQPIGNATAISADRVEQEPHEH